MTSKIQKPSVFFINVVKVSDPTRRSLGVYVSEQLYNSMPFPYFPEHAQIVVMEMVDLNLRGVTLVMKLIYPGVCHISKTTHPILTKFAASYEKKVTCEIISNSFECNHGNRIIAYIWLKVILWKVARKM